MNTCSPQEPLSEAQIAFNIKHYEYSQQFGANYMNRFENNMRECHDYQFQRQNEMNQQLKHRCINNVGPPPRPFKKARYAWEIKNYDYTMRRMSQPLEDEAISGGTSQDNTSEDRAPEICTLPNESRENESYDHEEVRPNLLNNSQQEYLGPVIPAGYPPHYGNFLNSNPGQRAAVLGQDIVQNEITQQIRPVDPDARLIRWHTRQLCRSIFDNTVNRMLENMGFSPVTEASRGLHPLLVLNLSDDEEREAEEAHQRALETHALSAALQQKGLIPPPYQYDYHLESATSSDYDSSEEEEEEEEESDGSDDVAPEPYVCLGPTSPCPSAENVCDFQKDCDVNVVVQPQKDQDLVPKCESLECPHDIPECESHECPHDASTTHLKLDDNENCIAKSETLIEGKVEQVLDDENAKTGDGENNNNDKFFIRNAIEMAIKQHGLGFQRA